MSHETITKKDPDAWAPGVFGMFNEKGSREENARRWKVEADKRKKARPLSRKLLFQDRTSGKDVMLEEAHLDNQMLDRGELPYSMYHQKLGQEILVESGLEPTRKFASANDLEKAIKPYDGTYVDRVHKAAERVKGSEKAA